jgi:hypothetical protein
MIRLLLVDYGEVVSMPLTEDTITSLTTPPAGGTELDEVVFIDDRAENTAAALNLGM